MVCLESAVIKRERKNSLSLFEKNDGLLSRIICFTFENKGNGIETKALCKKKYPKGNPALFFTCKSYVNWKKKYQIIVQRILYLFFVPTYIRISYSIEKVLPKYNFYINNWKMISQFIFKTVFCSMFAWHNSGVLSADL